MSTIEQNILVNRYPGVKSFSESEQLLFFGRENDIANLDSKIFLKQTVVLYGKSGNGKSSLINAGIIPKLKEKESWIYFSIRFNNFSEKETQQNLSPVETVKKRLSENVIDAAYTDTAYSEFSELIPGEDSFWYWIKLNQLRNIESKYIIFFDQFEELFTYPKEEISEFSEQLSYLLYTTLPPKFKKRLAELDEHNALSDALHNFLYKKPEIKVVFSIRSDKMSSMNILTDRHPTILQDYYELDALNAQDATSAIIQPARLAKELGFKTLPFEFTEGAITKILRSIANAQDGKIEAATLQILCRYIEDSLVADKKYTRITKENLGNITDIFQNYYEEVLSKLPQSERTKAQYLIEDELIDGDRRNALSAGYIQKRFGLSQGLLTQLEESSLLKKERDAAGRVLYEISHDNLINAINKVAVSRRQIEEEEKKKALKRQIEEEQKKSEELTIINRKVKNRSRIAVVSALACFLFAILTFFAMRKAKQESIRERSMRDTTQLLRAKLLVELGDSYFNGIDTSQTNMAKNVENSDAIKKTFYEALILYDSAFDLVKNYNNDNLLNQIKNREILCHEKLQY